MRRQGRPRLLLKTATNPTGAPKELFEGFRAPVQADRSQWNLDVTMPYYSFNRPLRISLVYVRRAAAV